MPVEPLLSPKKGITPAARPRRYRITLRGQFDKAWVQAFDPLSFTSAREHTLIEILADQAALRAVMNRLWDLNLDVLALEPLGPEFQGGGD